MNKKIISYIILIPVAIIIGVTAWLLFTNLSTKKAEGIVVDIKNINYEAKLITTYEEYEQLMKENEIPENEWNQLNKKDFKDNDFIVDYIPYEKGLKVNDIKIDIGDGISLYYVLSFEPKENQQLLLYFLPIEKNLIQNFYIANRQFDYAS